MFANSIITPIPDWETVTPWELVAWGVCVALAVLLGGLFFNLLLRPRGSRRPWIALGCLLAAMTVGMIGMMVATRGKVRQAMERLEQINQERETPDSLRKQESTDPNQ